MKKLMLTLLVATGSVLAMTSCGNKANQQDSIDETIVEGEVMEMPAAGTDTGVIAVGEAEAVQVQQQPE